MRLAQTLASALPATMAWLFAATPAFADSGCEPPPGVPAGARYSCRTHTQTQQIGEPSTTHPGGSAGRGGDVFSSGSNNSGSSRSGSGSTQTSVQCQLEADGSCNCNPRFATGRNIPCRPTQLTRQLRFTMKSYIARIGDKLGTTPRDPASGYSNPVAFKAAAIQTDLGFSEDPQSEDQSEGLYRMFSYVGLIATCQNGRMVRHELGTVLSDSGTEPSRPIAGFIAAHPDPMVIQPQPLQEVNGGRGVRFGWFGKARPAWFVEPFFTTVMSRRAVYIWQQLEVTVVCGAQGPQIDYANTKLTGSGFPSHRLWIDGSLVRTIPQGPFSNLWVADTRQANLIK